MPGVHWQEKLRQGSLRLLCGHSRRSGRGCSPATLSGWQERVGPVMCGPLAGRDARDAGCSHMNSVRSRIYTPYWLADPKNDGRPWTLFPKKDYELFQLPRPLKSSISSPGPCVRETLFTLTHAVSASATCSSSRKWMKKAGLTPWRTSTSLDKTYRIQRYLLYDPADPTAGMIQNEWSNPRLGRTGLTGFDVLRRRG